MPHTDTPETQRANRRFMRRAMTVPLLDKETEFELARRWREDGDEQALRDLTRAYMRLVISLATRFRNYGLPYGDLVQEGNVGLMQAAAQLRARVKLQRAHLRHMQAGGSARRSRDYILRNWSIVRTGTTAAHKSLFFNLRRLRSLIDSGTRQTLRQEDRIFIAQRLGVGVGDVETMDARLMAGDRSLNATLSDGTSEDNAAEWQDMLPLRTFAARRRSNGEARRRMPIALDRRSA